MATKEIAKNSINSILNRPEVISFNVLLSERKFFSALPFNDTTNLSTTNKFSEPWMLDYKPEQFQLDNCLYEDIKALS